MTDNFKRIRRARAAMAARAAPWIRSHREGSIVPRRSVPGRALVVVVAIMAFLSSITTGVVSVVQSSAAEWQSEVSQEVTIQIRPAQNRDIEGDVSRAAQIARSHPGVEDVQPFSRAEAARLLEPWLSGGRVIEELPVPRIIVVKLHAGGADLAALRKALADNVAGASLDDHRGWIEQMRAVASTVLIVGLGVVILMLVATILSVVFATRAAMAVNRPTIEVLHFVGARSAFITNEFQRHFLLLGLEGGLIGGGLAILLFGFASALVGFGAGSAASAQLSTLFGTFTLGFGAYLTILTQIAVVAAASALTSRYVIVRALATVE
jgi:cell division transport system permease protein